MRSRHSTAHEHIEAAWGCGSPAASAFAPAAPLAPSAVSQPRFSGPSFWFTPGTPLSSHHSTNLGKFPEARDARSSPGASPADDDLKGSQARKRHWGGRV